MPKMLVHLHLYYQEQLDFFIEKFKNISDCDWDLFVTTCENNELINKKILDFKPDAQIIHVENIGYDIYPFIQILNQVDLDKYDYVLKVHTKNYRKTPQTFRQKHFIIQGYSWRNELVNALIGNNKIFKKNLEILSKKNTGMIVSAKCLFEHSSKIKEDTELLNNFKEKYKINSNYNKYCAGTMFMIKASLLKKLISFQLSESDFGNHILQTNSGGELAHVIERIFTLLTDESGQKIYKRKIYHWSWKSILNFVFSQTKSFDKKHIVTTILGIKFKVRNNNIPTAFSIILPVYNQAHSIEKTLNSLINQSFKKWELIILDSGSNDNTETILKENYNKYFKSQKFIYKKLKHKKLCYIRYDGLSSARNENIYYMEAGDEIPPNYLEIFANEIDSTHSDCFYAHASQDGKIIVVPIEYNNLDSTKHIVLSDFIHSKYLLKKHKDFCEKLNNCIESDDMVLLKEKTK